MSSLSTLEIIQNFIYPYRLAPTENKALNTLTEASKYLDSIDLSSIIQDETTRESILKEFLRITSSFNTTFSQIFAIKNKIITQLFIRTIALQNEKLPKLVVSNLKPSALRKDHLEKVLLPFESSPQYHLFEETLIIRQSHIDAIPQELSKTFWENLEETLIQEGFTNPKLAFLTPRGRVDYPHFILQSFFKTKPELSLFNKKFTLIFQGNERLEEHYEILLLCGKVFQNLFKANLSDVASREIDLREYAPAVMVFKHGFEELLACLKQKAIKYPSLEMQGIALKAYLHMTPLFTRMATSQEELGKTYFLDSLRNLLDDPTRYSNYPFKTFVDIYNQDLKGKIAKLASESLTLEDFFSKIDPDDLVDVTQLVIDTADICLPSQIHHFTNLKRIELRSCDVNTFPLEIRGLKKLERITIHGRLEARPLALPDSALQKKTEVPINFRRSYSVDCFEFPKAEN